MAIFTLQDAIEFDPVADVVNPALQGKHLLLP
jgi:hypothetical protein